MGAIDDRDRRGHRSPGRPVADAARAAADDSEQGAGVQGCYGVAHSLFPGLDRPVVA